LEALITKSYLNGSGRRASISSKIFPLSFTASAIYSIETEPSEDKQ
jgi:hypothetical protein